MTTRESDHPIVLGGRESRPQGEGGDGGTEPSKDTCAGHAGPEYRKPTSLKGLARTGATRNAEASLTEEPGAGKPHAGICAGGVG